MPAAVLRAVITQSWARPGRQLLVGLVVVVATAFAAASVDAHRRRRRDHRAASWPAPRRPPRSSCSPPPRPSGCGAASSRPRCRPEPRTGCATPPGSPRWPPFEAGTVAVSRPGVPGDGEIWAVVTGGRRTAGPLPGGQRDAPGRAAGRGDQRGGRAADRAQGRRPVRPDRCRPAGGAPGRDRGGHGAGPGVEHRGRCRRRSSPSSPASARPSWTCWPPPVPPRPTCRARSPACSATGCGCARRRGALRRAATAFGGGLTGIFAALAVFGGGRRRGRHDHHVLRLRHRREAAAAQRAAAARGRRHPRPGAAGAAGQRRASPVCSPACSGWRCRWGWCSWYGWPSAVGAGGEPAGAGPDLVARRRLRRRGGADHAAGRGRPRGAGERAAPRRGDRPRGRLPAGRAPDPAGGRGGRAGGRVGHRVLADRRPRPTSSAPCSWSSSAACWPSARCWPPDRCCCPPIAWLVGIVLTPLSRLPGRIAVRSALRAPQPGQRHGRHPGAGQPAAVGGAGRAAVDEPPRCRTASRPGSRPPCSPWPRVISSCPPTWRRASPTLPESGPVAACSPPPWPAATACRSRSPPSTRRPSPPLLAGASDAGSLADLAPGTVALDRAQAAAWQVGVGSPLTFAAPGGPIELKVVAIYRSSGVLQPVTVHPQDLPRIAADAAGVRAGPRRPGRRHRRWTRCAARSPPPSARTPPCRCSPLPTSGPSWNGRCS